MDSKAFAHALLDQVLEGLEDGHRHILIWGLNEVALHLVSEAERLGLTSAGDWHIVDTDHSSSTADSVVLGAEVVAATQVAELRVDMLVITADREKERRLREYAKVDERIPSVIIAGDGHFDVLDPAFAKVRSQCLVKSYATGYKWSLYHLFQAIRYIATADLDGSVVEFGMFKGGTTEFIAAAFEHFGRENIEIFGFDTFDIFPKPGSLFDLYQNPDCEFQNSPAVENHARRHNIRVIEGDIRDTYRILEDRPLLLTFFDTDNYSAVKECLPLCYNQTVPGGVLAFDHYYSTEEFVYTIGERMAAREFFKDRAAFHLHGTGIFMKPGTYVWGGED